LLGAEKKKLKEKVALRGTRDKRKERGKLAKGVRNPLQEENGRKATREGGKLLAELETVSGGITHSRVRDKKHKRSKRYCELGGKKGRGWLVRRQEGIKKSNRHTQTRKSRTVRWSIEQERELTFGAYVNNVRPSGCCNTRDTPQKGTRGRGRQELGGQICGNPIKGDPIRKSGGGENYETVS